MTTQDELNSQQQAAIHHPAGPMRIIAGAGTGKTQTLTRRFVALVESGVPENRILALTFTTKAAAEMAHRITALLPAGHRKLWVSTFHSFCRSLLDEWNRAAGLPAPTVISDQVSRGYALDVVNQISGHALLVHHGDYGRERLAADLITLSSQTRDLMMTPLMVTAYANAHEDPPGRLHDLALACAAWATYLNQKGLQDFPQLGNQVVQRLKTDPDLLKRTCSRFDHVLVDEFQDTNFAQFALVQQLVPPGGNLCVVGDENQAIYAFRGGKPEYIAAFEAHYPGAATYRLTTNYRSGQTVLNAANQLISHNPGPNAISLVAADDTRAATLTVTPAANPDLEAEHIARSILTFAGKSDAPWRYTDVAILLRSTRLHAAPIQQALSARGIPFTIAGDRTAAAEAVHDALAALRLVAGPAAWRDAARLAAHKKTASAVHLRGVESRALSDEDRDALLAGDWGGNADFTFVQRQVIEASRTIASEAAALRHLPLPDLTYHAMVLSGRLDDRLDSGTARALSSFIQHATTLQDAGGNVESLLAHLTAGYNDLPHQSRGAGEGVQILTVHSAKGLEWPVVFLAGMADGQFPLPMKLDEAFDFDTLGDWRGGSETRLTEAERQQRFRQEERRLAYVAITRAKTELHITYPVRSESGGKLAPSPFIHEAGLADLTTNAAVFDPESPPASMLDVARQLRTRRNRALNALVDDPDVAEHLANLLLNQWAALGTAPGATLMRDRQLPAPHFAETTLALSFGQMNTYQECPRQYLYARVLKLDDPDDEESPALSVGSAVHAALEELNRAWHDRGAPPRDTAVIAAIERHWPERGFQFAAQGRQLRQRAEAMLLRYYAWERSRAPQRVPIGTEHQFQASYGPHQVRGRIDAVMQSEDGTVEIVDYKTTKYDNRTLKETESLQLFLYDYAWRQQRAGSNPAVAFYALRHKDDTGYVTQPEWVERQVKSMTHSGETRLEFTTELDLLIDGIISNAFVPKPAFDTCNRCAYRWLCPEG